MNNDEKQILNEVIVALQSKGYDPYGQIYGYVKTGNELYITSKDDARNKIVEYYSDYIDELSGGNEDMRQALILKLLEMISKFDCENPENNEKLLQELE